jgi:hypothetical protein
MILILNKRKKMSFVRLSINIPSTKFSYHAFNISQNEVVDFLPESSHQDKITPAEKSQIENLCSQVLTVLKDLDHRSFYDLDLNEFNVKLDESEDFADQLRIKILLKLSLKDVGQLS